MADQNWDRPTKTAEPKLAQMMFDAQRKLMKLRSDRHMLQRDWQMAIRTQEAEMDCLTHIKEAYLALREKIGYAKATARLEYTIKNHVSPPQTALHFRWH
mgnify:CR=1 FL=1